MKRNTAYASFGNEALELKRYRCKEKDCKRTFNDLTGTLLDGSKRSVMHWILATFLLCLSCSSRRIAPELGGHVRTGYRWCWWLRNAALSYEIGRQLEGTVEADDLYHTAGHKGQAKKGGKKSLGRRWWRRGFLCGLLTGDTVGLAGEAGKRLRVGGRLAGWCGRLGSSSIPRGAIAWPCIVEHDAQPQESE
jgi:hypothetical protein